jgi:hypothetical protein
MKLFLQGVQAVTVELLGVLVVVWSLFGFASWGLKSAAGAEPAWNRTLAAAVSAWKKDSGTQGPDPKTAGVWPRSSRHALMARRRTEDPTRITDSYYATGCPLCFSASLWSPP